MMQMLELPLADGKELDIPLASVVMFEEMNEESNPNFPNARGFIAYDMGNSIRHAVTSMKFDDLIYEMSATTDRRWLRLTRKDTGLRLVVLAQNVVGRLGLEEGCEITYLYGNQTQSAEVNESRREIKKWSERAAVPPSNLIPVPANAGA